MDAPHAFRELSPPSHAPTPPIPIPVPMPAHSRKRKHGAAAPAATLAASSPAPSEANGTPAPENLVLSSRSHDLASRPRLTISRHPVFVQLAPNSRYYTTEPLCNNRLNFRYVPAGLAPLDSAIPFRTIESAPTAYRVSWEDRSPFIKVTQDGLSLQGESGFRSARCNAPVRAGRWYMEVQIEHGDPARSKRPGGSHVRLGWARREAPLNGPAGLDGYSYAMRDKTGEKVHLSRPRPYGRAFGPGDVVGMYISLPPRRKADRRDAYDPAHIRRERIAIEFKGQEYFESLEYPQSKEMVALMDAKDRAKADSTTSLPSSSTKKSATVKNLPSSARGGKGDANGNGQPMRPLQTLGPESYIAFFVNGVSQGVAFQDLYDYLPLRTAPKAAEKKRANREGLREHKENPFDDGTLGYYPFISLFNGARVRINPGPDFAFPPPPNIDDAIANPHADVDVKPAVSESSRTWRPVHERYAEFMQEQWALDEKEEAEASKASQGEVERDKAKADKAEAHRAKRRAQAAARRERKPGDDGSEPSKRPRLEGTPLKVDSSRATPTMLPVTREGSERVPSPAPTVASSVDVHIAGPPGYGQHDASEYNSEYEGPEPEEGVKEQEDDVMAELEDAVS